MATDARSIIPLTHVCRYWRESIVSAPGNWTLISSYNMGLTALSLERSKAAPLQLRLGDSPSLRQEFRDLVTPYIQNTELLEFGGLATVDVFPQVLPDFPRSMPNLRLLKLAQQDTKLEWDPFIDPFESFPRTLRTLILYDIPLYPSFLKLGTLTKLSLHYYNAEPSLDAFLDLLQENLSLENVDLTIDFDDFPDPVSQDRIVIMDRLQRLSITFWEAAVGRTLISCIPIRRGAHLDITFRDEEEHLGFGLSDILSGIPMTHLSNLLSPTFMFYRSSSREIRLTGPNGSFTYSHQWNPRSPFTELPVLPLTNLKDLRIMLDEPSISFHPSSFPALEIFLVQCEADVSHLFSTLFPNPSFFPSLKTLGFLDCVITGEFMEEFDTVRLRPQDHNFGSVASRCDRWPRRGFPDCRFDSRTGEACTGC